MPNQSFVKQVAATIRRWRAVASTVALAAVCEIGARIGLPGVDGKAVQDFLRAGHGGMLWLYNLIAGGGTSRAALLAVGVVPYLSARLYLWLGRSLSPAIRARTDGATAKAKVIRGLTVGIAAVQAYGYVQMVSSIPNGVANPGVWFTVRSVAILTGGAIVASLLAEQILKGAPGDDDITVPSESIAEAAPGEKPIESALTAEAAGPLLLDAGGAGDVRPLGARELERLPR
jgi:preprotein translocase subunit SecY